MFNHMLQPPVCCPTGFQCQYTPGIIYPDHQLCAPCKGKKELILATTTSTVDTGLLDVLIPMFERKSGCNVIIKAVGTGAALAMGARGEADALLTHWPDLERKYVEEGFFTNYRLVMYNDFVIVGPPEDPAGIRGLESATDALERIACMEAPFVSRGDYSGTHLKEISLWERLGMVPSGDWYQQANAGMAETLGMASNQGAYTLSDRGTYLSQRQNLDLEILVEGDVRLLNIYHVMQVNPEKFPEVNEQCATAFVQFMVDPQTQRVIGEYGVERYGEPLFTPAAGQEMDEIV